MKRSQYFFFSLVLSTVLFFGIQDVFAQINTDLNFSQSAAFLNQANEGRTGLSNTDIRSQAATIITLAFQMVGVAFFILMVYGGFMWMTDRGNEEQVKKARDTVIAATIGLFVVLGAYALTTFVVDRFISPVTTSDDSLYENFCIGTVDCSDGKVCDTEENICVDPIELLDDINKFDDNVNDALNTT